MKEILNDLKIKQNLQKVRRELNDNRNAARKYIPTTIFKHNS